jgi:hypothetical protein
VLAWATEPAIMQEETDERYLDGAVRGGELLDRGEGANAKGVDVGEAAEGSAASGALHCVRFKSSKLGTQGKPAIVRRVSEYSTDQGSIAFGHSTTKTS